MECRNVQEAILDSLEVAAPGGALPEIDVHLAGCPACTAFAARQRSVDIRLSTMLSPPDLSPGFRRALHKRIRREVMQVWADSLPDKVHFMSCGLTTVICAIVMPFPAVSVLTAGAAATVVTFILLTAVRDLFESAGDAGS
jgi:predicted anti-sigma-YlaC factor YlaD